MPSPTVKMQNLSQPSDQNETIDQLLSEVTQNFRQDTLGESQDQAEKDRQLNNPVEDQYLATNIQEGLSDKEVANRCHLFGENKLSEEHENKFLKFLSFFRGPIQYVMLIAFFLAVGLQDWVDVGVIAAILLLNAIVGYVQEGQAKSVVESLKSQIALHATVVRNGARSEILVTDVVPGDVLVLEEGSYVAADCLIHNVQKLLQVDQSSLTGESFAVAKRVGESVYASSIVKQGGALAVVTCTGAQTFIGKTATLLQNAGKQQSHFQMVLNSIASKLLLTTGIFLLVLWLGCFFRSIDIVTILTFTLSILVISVPIGLPAVVTTTLAVGAADLARKQVIVQKLAAIESLAGVSILCTDKTGTLTLNKLRVGEPIAMSDSIDPNLIIAVSVMACSRKVKGLDPIDRAIIQTLRLYPYALEMVRRGEVASFEPFNPVTKWAASMATLNGKQVRCVKGSPNAVAELVQADVAPEILTQYHEKCDVLAKKGLRTLGVAMQVDGKWQLLGLLDLFDPLRHDTAQTIQQAKTLGLRVKMITGDALPIAQEVGRQLGLGQKAFSFRSVDRAGGESHENVISKLVQDTDIFAEVYPQDKYTVVDLLQKRNLIVAMTGDGVNDSPSLKKSNCGIAVEGASEAARSAADLVFLAAGLGNIIEAIKTSRQIFHRMRSYVVYRIALSLHLLIYILSSVLILGTAINIELVVFLAIFADVATLAIAYDNASYSTTPSTWRLKNLVIVSIVIGIVLAAGTWILLSTFFFQPGVVQSYADPQSVIFLEIVLTQNWLIFITRSDQEFWASKPSLQLLGAVFVVDALATVFCVFGWFGGPTDIVTVVKVWVFSFGVFIVLAVIYNWLNKQQGSKEHQANGLPEHDIAMQEVKVSTPQ